MRQSTPLWFLLETVLIQIIALAVALTLVAEGLFPGTWCIGVLSVAGFVLAYWLSLPPSWQILNAAVLPAAISYSYTGLSPNVLLILAGLTGLVFLPTFLTRIPYYPTSLPVFKGVLDLLPKDRSIRMVDLGSGFGSLIFFLSAQRPESLFLGVELAPLPFLLSFIRAIPRSNLQIRPKNFWNLNLAEFDVVYCFLAPPPMARLLAKARNEMRPGTLFISNSFDPGEPPDEVVEFGNQRLLVYIMPS